MTRPVATQQQSHAPMSVVLRINTFVAIIIGVVLLAAPWSEPFEHLNDFRPVPWIYAQLAGAALIGLAWMLWRASRDDGAQQLVAQGAAILNIVAFVCIAIWLFSDDKGIPGSGSFGSWTFDAVAIVLLVLGILEARAFRGSKS
ncbi:MAG: hypothetical protein WD598_13735 [Acidimicrobiia bacterium]